LQDYLVPVSGSESDESWCVRVEAMRSFNRISEINLAALSFENEANVHQLWYNQNHSQLRKRLNCND